MGAGKLMQQKQQINAAKQAQTEALVAKLFTDLTLTDRKGIWDIRKEELKLTKDNIISPELEQPPVSPPAVQMFEQNMVQPSPQTAP